MIDFVIDCVLNFYIINSSSTILTLQVHDKFKKPYSNETDYVRISYSRRANISKFFGRCAWAQSNGFGYSCNGTASSTHDNLPTIISSCNFTEALDLFSDIRDFNYFLIDLPWATLLASLQTVLTLTCAFLYIFLCLKLRTRAVNVTGRSDMHKLHLRLSVIVVLNTLCWIPVTVLHWITVYDYNLKKVSSWLNDSTAACVLLISISPTVNPLIYTFTGKNFFHSMRKCWRRMKCDISVRRSSSNYHEDHIRRVERCSCIPCIRCVHQDEENDPDYCKTQDTSDWNSDQSRLLPSTNESSEII